MIVNQAALHELLNAEFERQVPDRVKDSIATIVEATFMDTIQLVTDSQASLEKSTRNGLIDVPISEMIEIGYLDSYLDG